MRIGVPKERLAGEGRVALLPDAVRALVRAGHEVRVEVGAGAGAGVTDQQFVKAGAELVDDYRRLYAASELIVKVKEPQLEEVACLRPDHMVFCFLHLAVHPDLSQALADTGCLAIAYEGIQVDDGVFPVLSTMSRIAGRLAVHLGAVQLLQHSGGKGLLLGSAPGRAAGRVVVLGCGVAGRAAIAAALEMGAKVTALDIKPAVLEELMEEYDGLVEAQLPTDDALVMAVADADLLVGAVLVPGAKAPCLVSRANVAQMQPGSVIVDIAIDQGGCIETSRPTTYDSPTYVDEGVVHYCVGNLPAAVSQTASHALVSASAPYVKQIAELGRAGLLADPVLGAAIQVRDGRLADQLACE